MCFWVYLSIEAKAINIFHLLIFVAYSVLDSSRFDDSLMRRKLGRRRAKGKSQSITRRIPYTIDDMLYLLLAEEQICIQLNTEGSDIRTIHSSSVVCHRS